jgi:hypothetical protein
VSTINGRLLSVLLNACFLSLLLLLQVLLIPDAHDVGCFAPNVSYTGYACMLLSATSTQDHCSTLAVCCCGCMKLLSSVVELESAAAGHVQTRIT